MMERFARFLSTFTLSFDHLQQLLEEQGRHFEMWIHFSLKALQCWAGVVSESSSLVLSCCTLWEAAAIKCPPTITIQLRWGELRYRTWQLSASGPCIIPSLVLCQPRCRADVCLGLQDAGRVYSSISSKPLSHMAAEQAWEKRRWLWLVPIRV